MYDNRPTTRHPNFDLLWSIFNLRDDIEIDITWGHVKGHQDKAEIDQPLTRFELLNCKVNKGAKELLQYVKHHNIQLTTRLFGPQWTLKSSDGAIYKDFSARIYMQQHGAALKHRIKQKHGYTEEVMNSIDWKSIGNTGRSMPIYE